MKPYQIFLATCCMLSQGFGAAVWSALIDKDSETSRATVVSAAPRPNTKEKQALIKGPSQELQESYCCWCWRSLISLCIDDGEESRHSSSKGPSRSAAPLVADSIYSRPSYRYVGSSSGLDFNERRQ